MYCIVNTMQNIIRKIFYLQTNKEVMKKNLTSIDLFIIDAVKKRREALNITPNKLSVMIGLNRNFIYRIETLEYKEKYTPHHLNEIAKVLNCKIADFFPMPYLEQDCIEEYHEIRERRRQELNKWCSVPVCYSKVNINNDYIGKIKESI